MLKSHTVFTGQLFLSHTDYLNVPASQYMLMNKILHYSQSNISSSKTHRAIQYISLPLNRRPYSILVSYILSICILWNSISFTGMVYRGRASYEHVQSIVVRHHMWWTQTEQKSTNCEHRLNNGLASFFSLNMTVLDYMNLVFPQMPQTNGLIGWVCNTLGLMHTIIKYVHTEIC